MTGAPTIKVRKNFYRQELGCLIGGILEMSGKNYFDTYPKVISRCVKAASRSEGLP